MVLYVQHDAVIDVIDVINVIGDVLGFKINDASVVQMSVWI